MKVIQINSVCKSGSVAKIAVQIQKVLLNQGYDSSIAFGRGEAVEGVNCYKFSSELEFKIHVALNRITDKHGLYSSHATKKLINYLRKEKPDIVHVHCIHGYYVNYKLLFDYFSEAKVPIIWTFHDCWSFTGHCAFFDLVKCDRWKTGCFECPNKKLYPSSYFCDSSISNYEIKKTSFNSVENMIIVTPSEWLKNLVSESFLSSYETVVINNGIDCNVFKPIEDKSIIRNIYNKYLPYEYGEKKIILGVANIWSKRKGLDDFIELNNILSSDYQIFLVGLSETQINSLPHNIIGIKRTDSASDLAALYCGANCFLNLTYEDNYPTTNIEALSCGTPVITYDTGGSGEMIPDKSCVVEQGDIHSVLNTIKRVEKQRVNVEGKFDSKYCFNKYVELYMRVYEKCSKENLEE